LHILQAFFRTNDVFGTLSALVRRKFGFSEENETMKKTVILVITCLVAIILFAGKPLAFQADTQKQLPAEKHTPGDKTPAIGIDKLNDVMGKTVKNAQGEELGSVEGILGEGGLINYVILSRNHTPQTGRLIPIPCRAVQACIQEDAVILNVEKKHLAKAPTFAEANQPDFSEPEWNRKIHAYYGHNAVFEVQERGFYLLLR
jgi:hypothetical protein